MQILKLVTMVQWSRIVGGYQAFWASGKWVQSHSYLAPHFGIGKTKGTDPRRIEKRDPTLLTGCAALWVKMNVNWRVRNTANPELAFITHDMQT